MIEVLCNDKENSRLVSLAVQVFRSLKDILLMTLFQHFTCSIQCTKETVFCQVKFFLHVPYSCLEDIYQDWFTEMHMGHTGE